MSITKGKKPHKGEETIEFADAGHLVDLFGEHDRHLAQIEEAFDVSVTPRGNLVSIKGSNRGRKQASSILKDLYQRLQDGFGVELADVEGAIRFVEHGVDPEDITVDADVQIKTARRHITPRSPQQAKYIRAMREQELVFGLGPAGTGKTYLAVAAAVSMMLEGRIERIILSRPAVEAGERLGFLPGDLREKVDPYLRPLYDALYDTLPGDVVNKKLENGEIEVAPLAYMRGRTLAHSFVILDEAQNATPVQMKMFLTRMGEDSRMVITGDPSQIDLPKPSPSGLLDAKHILRNIDGVSFVQFSEKDVVRHALGGRIVNAYDRHERSKKENADSD